jgi:hypothetical protein
MVAVELGEELRDLPLAEGVVEGIVDVRGADPEAGGLVAVDGQRQCGARELLVAGEARQLG